MKIGHQTTFSIKDGETYTEIAGIGDIQSPEIVDDFIDVTTHSDPEPVYVRSTYLRARTKTHVALFAINGMEGNRDGVTVHLTLAVMFPRR